MEGNVILSAVTPEQMDAEHRRLAVWAEKMERQCELEENELQTELEIAVRSKWATTGYKKRIVTSRKRRVFFAKVKAAVDAGYSLVPNFGMDLFAVRTTREHPRGKAYWSTWRRDEFEQTAMILPMGEGRYVRSSVGYLLTDFRKNEDDRREHLCAPAENMEPPEFPLELARPELMTQVEKAMALKLYDEIGVARDFRGCGDPFLLGRILNPKRTRADATFFLGWYFDPRSF